jgi:hypothetical protein
MAKKRANNKKKSGDLDDEIHRDRYFLRGGKAYVQVQSGDIFGPYGKETAAYQRAAKDSLSGRTSEFGTRSVLEGMRSYMRGGGGSRITGK